MARRNSNQLIATLPPYVDRRHLIIGNPSVDELRFNTVSPIATNRRDLLARLHRECGGKRLWIDLKGRQLRIAKFAYLPYAYVELTHEISVDLPAVICFKDSVGCVVAIVDGHKLILNSRPCRVVGEGEPVNILHPSLRIKGYLTESDHEYVAAAVKLDLHDYMLSFAEQDEDIAELMALDPQAHVMAKIESLRGLQWMRHRPYDVGLMAARDDLYINMGDGHTAILDALRDIRTADRNAVAASRFLESLEKGDTPSLTDITDIALMLSMGYKRFMLGDMICFHEEAFHAALALMAKLLGKAEGSKRQ